MAAAHPIGEAEHHPSPAVYVRVAIILCIFTAVEVAVYYMQPVRDLNLLPPILIILSAAKFATVVGYYMHLKFDHRIFTGLFAAGLALAGVVILLLMSLFGELLASGRPINSISTQAALAAAQNAASAKAAGAPAAVDASSIGNVANGKALFVSKTCTACHMAPGVPGSATIGPNQAGFASRGTIAGGVLPNTPENVQKWLTDPPAVKPGTLMPNLGLTEAEKKDLTAFLYSLK